MKTYKQFQIDYIQALPHTIFDPNTKKEIHIPKGKAVAIKSRSSVGSGTASTGDSGGGSGGSGGGSGGAGGGGGSGGSGGGSGGGNGD